MQSRLMRPVFQHGQNMSRPRNTKNILLPYCMSQSVINQPFLFTDMSHTDENIKGITASQPARPSWAVSVNNDEAWELMNTTFATKEIL